MFENFKNIVKKASKLSTDKLVFAIMKDKDITDEMVRMNTMDQLYDEGIDSKGNFLGYYSPATIQGTQNFEGKIQKGQRHDHITLNDSGKFYASEKVKLYADGMTFSAQTQKTSNETVIYYDEKGKGLKSSKKKKVVDTDLIKDFGKDILGLTNENLSYVIKDVQKALPGQIRKEIFT